MARRKFIPPTGTSARKASVARWRQPRPTAAFTPALEKVDGAVRVQSSNGGIDLTLPANAQSAVRAHTSNNGITVHLPGEVNARLSAAHQ